MVDSGGVWIHGDPGSGGSLLCGRPLCWEAEQLRSSGDVRAGATAPSHMVSSMVPVELDIAISDLAAATSQASPST